MTGYELYSLVLCIAVLASLSTLFIVFLRISIGYYLRLLRNGLEDEALLAEEAAKKPERSAWDRLNAAISGLVCTVLIAAFALSVAITLTEDKHPFGLPTLTVVKSSSMSYKEETNRYLFESGSDDQFDTFDLLVIEALPDEYELKLYDVVVYEAKDGTMIVHRIVGIEEPNAEHPDHRRFRFQGDAVQLSDRYPVLYSQMRGIYRGDRLPFVGSFILFMQSPAGWICILLVLFAVIATPIVEKRIQREKALRLAILHELGSQHGGIVDLSMQAWKRIHRSLRRIWRSQDEQNGGKKR